MLLACNIGLADINKLFLIPSNNSVMLLKFMSGGTATLFVLLRVFNWACKQLMILKCSKCV